jgi:hypothetical protein
LILQRYSRYAVVGLLDPETREFTIKERAELVERALGIHGQYELVNGHLLALYLIDGHLCLRVDDEEFLCDEPQFSAVWSRESQSSRRLVVTGTRSSAKVDYRLDAIAYHWLEGPREQEDDDFGQWIVNIVNSEERRAVVREVWRPDR